MSLGRVVVTGATGFVGSAIVRSLVAAGYPVRAVCRASSRRDNLAGLDIDIVDADICDAEAVPRAMARARDLAHAAADYRLWARDPGAGTPTNLLSTRTAMEAAPGGGG